MDDSKKSEFLKSKEAVKLGARMRDLKERYQSLSKLKSIEVELKANVKLEVEASCDHEELFNEVYSYNRTLEDFFSVDCNGDITNNNYPAEMNQQLQDALDDILNNACAEIIGISPTHKESLDAFVEDINNIQNEFQDNDIYDNDLEILLQLKEEAPKSKKSRKKKS